MRSKRGLPEGSCLCVILDSQILGYGKIARVARLAADAGADMLQLRCKGADVKAMARTALAVKRIAKARNVTLIINDRPEVALAVNADGAHVGREDIDASLARRLMGPDKILGVSAANTTEAIKARSAGASYIGAGPVFNTPIKSGRKAKGLKLLYKIRRMNIPLLAIGGIDGKSIKMLAKKGFKGVAVIRAVCEARDPFNAAKRLKEALA